MKYQTADQLLPHELIAELQKYVSGSLLYIPAIEKKAWGESSGTKKELASRNESIRAAHADGTSIAELASDYYLAESTIKNILYRK